MAATNKSKKSTNRTNAVQSQGPVATPLQQGQMGQESRGGGSGGQAVHQQGRTNASTLGQPRRVMLTCPAYVLGGNLIIDMEAWIQGFGIQGLQQQGQTRARASGTRKSRSSNKKKNAAAAGAGVGQPQYAGV